MKEHLNTLIVAATVLVATFLMTYTFQHRASTSHAITVTGLGSKDFVSDLIVWSGTFTRKSANLKEAYASLDADREQIREYLVSKKIDVNDIVFSAVHIEKQYEPVMDQHGNTLKSVFTGYLLEQKVHLESADVDHVEQISREVSELINLGVEFYSNLPEYYYTRLAELKIEMIAEATQDANRRAMNIAKNAGGEVGDLKSADMGVFQIVAQNSSEGYSWGGSFNTTSKRKTATITVSLVYQVD